MGYTTDFDGEFNLDKPLTLNQINYLNKFNETRRMKRDNSLLPTSGLHQSVNLPLGVEGEYFVDGLGFAGQDRSENIIDYNATPTTQPSLWCQWCPSEDGESIVWDEGEKFYCYTEWLEYLIFNFLEPWGYKLNGVVKWYGEDHNDRGEIHVNDNKIEIYEYETKLVKI